MSVEPPPSNLEAEQGVLGSLLLMSEKFITYQEIAEQEPPDAYIEFGLGEIALHVKSICDPLVALMRSKDRELEEWRLGKLLSQDEVVVTDWMRVILGFQNGKCVDKLLMSRLYRKELRLKAGVVV